MLLIWLQLPPPSTQTLSCRSLSTPTPGKSTCLAGSTCQMQMCPSSVRCLEMPPTPWFLLNSVAPLPSSSMAWPIPGPSPMFVWWRTDFFGLTWPKMCVCGQPPVFPTSVPMYTATFVPPWTFSPFLVAISTIYMLI